MNVLLSARQHVRVSQGAARSRSGEANYVVFEYQVLAVLEEAALTCGQAYFNRQDCRFKSILRSSDGILSQNQLCVKCFLAEKAYGIRIHGQHHFGATCNNGFLLVLALFSPTDQPRLLHYPSFVISHHVVGESDLHLAMVESDLQHPLYFFSLSYLTPSTPSFLCSLAIGCSLL